MGYYSTLIIGPNVRGKNIEDVRGILAGIKMKIAARIAEPWEHELDWLTLDDDGEFNVENTDWNAKWYNEKDWVYALAPFLENGDIDLIGEEGERYGYRIIDGIAYDLYYSWKIELGEPLKKEKIRRKIYETSTVSGNIKVCY